VVDGVTTGAVGGPAGGGRCQAGDAHSGGRERENDPAEQTRNGRKDSTSTHETSQVSAEFGLREGPAADEREQPGGR
jgi:hypothetical protein